MKAVHLLVGFTFAFALVGCGGGSDGGADAAKVMPDLTGRQLDVALSDIKNAGFEDDVDIVGGGTFGVVNESNWTVCAQSPAAGQTIASPQLTVDRECEGEETQPAVETDAPAPTEAPPVESAAPAPTEAPAEPPVVTEPAAPASDILTVENSPEMAAVLVEPDSCSHTIEAFATTYQGRTIEFDGHIAAVNNHGDYDTRWDFLISPGEAPGVVGPAFQFRDVGRVDLHLPDESTPGLNLGDNLHVVAEIVDYNPDNCLFFLDPVSTGVR